MSRRHKLIYRQQKMPKRKPIATDRQHGTSSASWRTRLSISPAAAAAAAGGATSARWQAVVSAATTCLSARPAVPRRTDDTKTETAAAVDRSASNDTQRHAESIQSGSCHGVYSTVLDSRQTQNVADVCWFTEQHTLSHVVTCYCIVCVNYSCNSRFA